MPLIANRYLLVSHIPLYRGSDGRTYIDQLWFTDLAEHLSYLGNFTLACPVVQRTPPKSAVPAVQFDSDPRFSRVQIVALPAPGSFAQAILLLPATIAKLWRAIRAADIVHSGVCGWPIPPGWIVAPLARLLGKKSLIIVEGASWRLQPGLVASLKSRIVASVYERMARWCLYHADLAIFTSDHYRQSLLARRREKGHVIHASWIDEEAVLSDQQAERIWRQKTSQNRGELRLLFAGRLEAAKGVLVLLQAINLVANKNASVRLDILGIGDLAVNCKAASSELRGTTRVQMLGTVPYGPPLFQLLQHYHAIVLPSLSDEQPRIVYDAYSQGVPALATKTSGLRDCIVDNQTGWLVEPNDAVSLSDLLLQASTHFEELRNMGMNALKVARAMTHQKMHRERQRMLLQLLG
jgi:glycosyltransferase involved in cell wall biosynthesis